MSISASYIVPHPPLIVPEVGKGQEKAIRKTSESYHTIARQIADAKPDTIIVITPHSVIYEDYIHISPGNRAEGSLQQFGAKSIYSVSYDTALIDELCRICTKLDFPAGPLGEKDNALDHGTLVPLYFVNQYYPNSQYQLVRCSIAGLSRQEHYHFGMILRQAVEALGRNAVVIASGDLSHKLSAEGPYGFAPEGPILDQQLIRVMQAASFGDFLDLDFTLCNRGAECGLASFIIMAGVWDKKSVDTQFLSYEGPFGVGYAVCAYQESGDDPHRDFLQQNIVQSNRNMQSIRGKEDAFVRLARHTLECYITTGKLLSPPMDLSDTLLKERAGVFVSLKKNGQLRGCIGTTEPTQQSIAEEIIHNAISAGTHDPRFSPVQNDELPSLVYSVDVLSPAEPICDKSMLDVLRYGVIVTSGRKRGLLLPNLEGVATVDEQIEIACQKAGIACHESYTLERFEVVRHT